MIRNKTRKTILCRRTELADSLWKKAKGLMFRKSLERDSGMLFIFPSPARSSFWTPFMRFPLDMVFLDSSKRVLEIRENLKPWRILKPSFPAKYVLELRAGKVRETGTLKGDLLDFRV